ncbi:MAG: ABC transporter permease [Clostridia bacterium]|nr:ABC transporter permease [Clostridia bacterium]
MRGEVNKLKFLVARNIKLYFKDKLTFFVSLITPLILVFLFLTFLRQVYETSLIECLPEGFTLSDRLVNAFTGGWLFSSIMTTSCITVSFCSNLLVNDKINKVYNDFQIAPIKKSTVQISYAISNFITTFIVCFVVLVLSMIYLAIVGWYLSFLDLVLILVNMILLIMFGTLLATIIGFFISSQGAQSAVCTLVSSMYGFICGAYMPIASFGNGMKYFVSFIPGTYSTVLFRQFYFGGVLEEMKKTIPEQAVEGIKDGFDGNFYFFDNQVPSWAMFLIIICSCVVLFGILTLIIHLKNKKKKEKHISVETVSETK